ncbi:sensor histidine kinase [Capillimicrobium parvum]|uniref:sensor histidine kinase n=1 Tax=Capillimicrobium parvum TaxID=2884022 RepID=UPI00216B3D84|nr:ATP-binding protein [Capillimicrobium parvum]
MSRLRVGQWFALATVVFGVAALVAAAIGILGLVRLSDARNEVVDRLDPSTVAALSLSNALLNQESGVRGYALTGRDAFLDPYRNGRRAETSAIASLRSLAPGDDTRGLTGDIERVRRAGAAWRHDYAKPTILAVRAFGRRPAAVADERGKARFDEVRAAVRTLQQDLSAARDDARSRLRRAAGLLNVTLAVMLGLLAAAGVLGLIALRWVVSRPLARLGAETRGVARGDFTHAVTARGPRDIVALGSDVETMRRQIVEELEAVREANARLDRQALELQRSNAELEQFAYVASHDLQEPLRKVASFTQLLQRRYQGRLDERADQYIEFAVDGAVRMQRLINDLLTFSRVGRLGGAQELVDARELVEAACGNLDGVIEESGAEIDVGELPAVRGESGLLTAVFQNLIGNALKFRGPDTPRVQIQAVSEDDCWRFTVADNGIGIEPEYADRIFVIFQRLHTKEAYAGTGIGLALCRKIVEYHGGRIWLDTDVAAGTTFHFTLPVPEERR